jgi:hypothetical protein
MVEDLILQMTIYSYIENLKQFMHEKFNYHVLRNLVSVDILINPHPSTFQSYL